MDPKPTSLPDSEERDCIDCGKKFLHQYTEIEKMFPALAAKRCPICAEEKQRKIIREDEEREEFNREREELLAKQRIFRKLEALDIGNRFRGLSWHDYVDVNAKATKAKNVCIEYVKNFAQDSGACLMMLGSPGTGKNMLAAIIAQEVIKLGFTCVHTTALRMVRRVKDSWRNKEISEQDVIDAFCSPDLLIIDEIGVQFGSQTEQLYLTEIINDRYESQSPTVIISNLDGAQLKAILGERIIDRFFDDGSKALAFDWESYRRRKNG